MTLPFIPVTFYFTNVFEIDTYSSGQLDIALVEFMAFCAISFQSIFHFSIVAFDSIEC